MASQGVTQLREGRPQRGVVGVDRGIAQYYEFYNSPDERGSFQVLNEYPCAHFLMRRSRAQIFYLEQRGL